MKIIEDVFSIIQSLSFVDYILYFSVLALIVLSASLIYVIKSDDQEDNSSKGDGDKDMLKDDELDLQQIVNTISETKEPVVDMTSYEQEQEQKAIISYDELINSAKNKQINIGNEELVDNCIPYKKINLNEMINNDNKIDINESDTVFHYEREEAFLKTLQELNQLLN